MLPSSKLCCLELSALSGRGQRYLVPEKINLSAYIENRGKANLVDCGPLGVIPRFVNLLPSLEEYGRGTYLGVSPSIWFYDV